MEKRYKPTVWVWIGSILVAILVLGTMAFGAYRLYALGWAQGVASLNDGIVEAVPQPPVITAPAFYAHRMRRAPLFPIFLGLLLVCAIFRHRAWRMHPEGWYRHHPHFKGWPHYPGCDTKQDECDMHSEGNPV